MEYFMKYKVHWLIDGLVEIDANDADTAEKLLKNKIVYELWHIS